MKTLLLLRHAKSSWANPELPDHGRPLNKRGQRGAAAIGAWLHGQALKIDVALVSDARRAQETFTGLGLPMRATLEPRLYHAEPSEMLDILGERPEDTVLLIGHNPGIGALASDLAASPPDHPRFDQFPTAALLVLKFDTPEWNDVTHASGRSRRS